MIDKCLKMLSERGVAMSDLIGLVKDIQKPFMDHIDEQDVEDKIMKVLSKVEVQYAILTGINLDILAEKNLLDEDLNNLLMQDVGRYSIDETLACAICNLHGAMALTNFGHVDCEKLGILKDINNPPKGVCNTFLDDLVGAIAASAASLMAYEKTM